MTPLSGSKGRRSRSPGRFTHRVLNAWGRCSGDPENVLVLGVGNYCYVESARRRTRGAGAPTGEERGGAYRVATHTACFVNNFVKKSTNFNNFGGNLTLENCKIVTSRKSVIFVILTVKKTILTISSNNFEQKAILLKILYTKIVKLGWFSRDIQENKRGCVSKHTAYP